MNYHGISDTSRMCMLNAMETCFGSKLYEGAHEFIVDYLNEYGNGYNSDHFYMLEECAPCTIIESDDWYTLDMSECKQYFVISLYDKTRIRVRAETTIIVCQLFDNAPGHAFAMQALNVPYVLKLSVFKEVFFILPHGYIVDIWKDDNV